MAEQFFNPLLYPPPDYSFLDERPTDVRGVAQQIRRFWEITEKLRAMPDERLATYVDEWFRMESKAVEWTTIVCKRIDSQRSEALSWWPSTYSNMGNLAAFPQFARQMPYVVDQLDAWADEIDLFDAPSLGAWVLVGDQPYSAWQQCKQVVGSTTKSIVLADPYVAADTLDLLMSAPDTVTAHIMTVETNVPDGFRADWDRWQSQRSGASECRVAPKADMPHDRFLIIDGDVYLSGATFKDVGGRLSVLVRIDSSGVAKTIVDELEAAWQLATPI